MKCLRISSLCILLFLAALLPFSSVQSESPQRRLTVMVYMCGSNLESSQGSASADILEMQNACVDPSETGLLVMTGGSNKDTGNFSAGSAKILEIAGDRKRIIWDAGAMNMGEQATLTRFIQYCTENRPAEQYALILWDHGGGPLEGVCWDENHSMDHLSLAELTGALSEAGLDRKLSWIGFDACLMSSLEVAGQLAPYAGYMIASQETEPAFGWNYSFLAGAGKDANGAETGRRIVDAYFDGREDSREILTLCCTDLSAVNDVIRAMDPVFLPLSRRLDQSSFLSLSGLRMNSTGFGKAGPEAPATGYDLVDIRDLVAGLDANENTESLLALLDRAIVYNRSNEEGANGLTLYHPYFNKTGYTEKWKDGYQQLSFSEGYQTYVNTFGGMLTGEILFRWLDLIPRSPQVNEDRSCSVELQLTEEQAENAVTAQLLIVRDTLGNELDRNCVLIASCSAAIGDDHTVRATWDGRALYAESDSGMIAGPLSYTLTEDGTTNTIICHCILKDDYELNGQDVLFELDAADTSEYPEFKRIRVWDEATQSFSSRLSFSEDSFSIMQFWNYHRIFPGIDAAQALPVFEQWANNHTTVVTSNLYLPDTWKLHAAPLRSGQQIYALFRILDSQQNAVCSLPVAIPDPSLSVLKPTGGTVENDLIKADLYCRINTSDSKPGLQLEWNLENRRDKKVTFTLKDPLVNGVRLVDGSLYQALQPGNSSRTTTTVNPSDLAFLSTLESISGTLAVSSPGQETEFLPFCFTFSSEDISALSGNTTVLSEAEHSGISLKLLSVREDRNIGWQISILARNGGKEDYAFGEVLLNAIHMNARMNEDLPAGKERVYTVEESNNYCSLRNSLPNTDAIVQVLYLEENILESMDVHELNSITVLANSQSAERTMFELPVEPHMPLETRQRVDRPDALIPDFYPPDDLPAPDEQNLPILAENNLYQVRLRRLTAGSAMISLMLEYTNKSGEWLALQSGKASVNGQEVSSSDTAHLAPHSTVITEAFISGAVLKEPGTAVQKLTLTVWDSERDASIPAKPAVLISPEPIPMGLPDGYWINGERFNVVTVHTRDADLKNEKDVKALKTELVLPDDPESFRKVIEVPLDPDMEEKIDFCRVALLRRDADDFWQVITLNDVLPDGSGTLHIPHPGLFPTFTENPEICVMTRLGGVNSETVSGDLVFDITMFSDNGSFTLNSVKWEMDRASGTARITDYEQDQIPYTRQWEIRGAMISSMEIRIVPGSDGTLPHIGECENRPGLLNSNLPHDLELDSEPLRLELRPITAEDDLYIMVSALGKDKSKWSLPLLPWPTE